MKNSKTCVIYLSSSTLYLLYLIYLLIFNYQSLLNNLFHTLLLIIIGIIIPLLLELTIKIFSIEISYKIKLFLIIFAIMHIFFGELLDFYNKIYFWDSILHIISGIAAGIIMFLFSINYLDNYKIKTKLYLSVLLSIMFSLTIALTWEIIEFSIDSIFATNMQKFIPQLEEITVNNSNNMLEGSNEIIAEFYKHPTGYKYALVDTMTDLLLGFIGSIISAIIITIIIKTNKTNIFKNEAKLKIEEI